MSMLNQMNLRAILFEKLWYLKHCAFKCSHQSYWIAWMWKAITKTKTWDYINITLVHMELIVNIWQLKDAKQQFPFVMLYAHMLHIMTCIAIFIIKLILFHLQPTITSKTRPAITLLYHSILYNTASLTPCLFRSLYRHYF